MIHLYLTALQMLTALVLAFLTIYAAFCAIKFAYHIIIRYKYFRDNRSYNGFNARTIIRYAWGDLWRY